METRARTNVLRRTSPNPAQQHPAGFDCLSVRESPSQNSPGRHLLPPPPPPLAVPNRVKPCKKPFRGAQVSHPEGGVSKSTPLFVCFPPHPPFPPNAMSTSGKSRTSVWFAARDTHPPSRRACVDMTRGLERRRSVDVSGEEQQVAEVSNGRPSSAHPTRAAGRCLWSREAAPSESLRTARIQCCLSGGGRGGRAHTVELY